MIGDLEIHLVHNTRGKMEFGGKKIQKGCSLPRSLVLRLEKEKDQKRCCGLRVLHRWRAKRVVRLTLAFDWLFRWGKEDSEKVTVRTSSPTDRTEAAQPGESVTKDTNAWGEE